MASIPASAPARPSAGLAASTLGIARRGLLKFLRTPQLVVVGTVQSALFLLIFRYVFGGAIGAGGLDYVDFLVPGFITTGLLFAGMGAAAGDGRGPGAGLRGPAPLPAHPQERRPGRPGAWPTPPCWCGAWPSPAPSASPSGSGSTAAWPTPWPRSGCCVVFGFAFEWMFLTLGLFAGTAQAAQGLALMVFPLTFVSSAYVPVDSMPGWMQAFAEHQPVTVMVDAVRVAHPGPGGRGCCSATAPGSTWSGRWPGRRSSWRCSCRSPWPATGATDRPGCGG